MGRKHSYIGGIIGADPLLSGSPRPGVSNLGSLGGDGASDEHWDDVTLLLNGDDATIADVSSASTTLAVGNSVSRSTSVYKYGSGSLRFDESAAGDSGTYISYDGPNLGTGDFTVEMWWRPDALPLGSYAYDENIWDTRKNNSNHPLINYSGGTGDAEINLFADGSFKISSAASLTASTWHHIALVRSGGRYELFVDGGSQGTYDTATAVSATEHYIGRKFSGTNFYSLNAHLDDFRFTPGVARYTAAFTPPTASFPTTSSVTRPTRRWGGITGRSLVTSGGNVPTTGVLSLAEMLQARPGGAIWDGNGAEILMVAGGGGGGSNGRYRGSGGGGGAGAYRTLSNHALTTGTSYNITVGNGGAGGSQASGYNSGISIGGDGSATTAFGYTQDGGGGGGEGLYASGRSSTGTDGGSGGGGGYQNAGGSGGSLGNNGNSGTSGSPYAGGGGGGAGAAGSNGSGGNGHGGIGSQWAADGTYYAGGGGGGAESSTTGVGGDGGGGDALPQTALNSSLTADAGTPNTGGGGGGSSGQEACNGGDGGSGVVKIWIPTANYSNYTATGLTVSADTAFTRADTSAVGTMLSITSGSGTITFN